MKNLFKIICISLLFFSIIANSQTVTALQQQNARATGYAIVAAKNPGKSFSVFIVKWDGVHDLEYNANNQINTGWHPQAVIKGNYFDQPFVNNDFTVYSSVVVSQVEFDTYKAAGSDWWIVCSTLPSFSNTGLSVLDNGNVGIGTITPNRKLEVKSGDSEQLVLTSTNASNLAGIYLNPANTTWTPFIGATGNDLVLHTSGAEKLRILSNGNVGIGTTNPDTKLTVKGKIHAQEVKVDMAGPLVPDYIFSRDYKLRTLQEVEEYIKKNSHLPEIPSAAEFEKNGLMLAEMNMCLLKKIEEMTLYIIEQNKRIEKLEISNSKI